MERRFDFTVLATVFTFGALLNAFAMISPVYAVEQWTAEKTGLRVEWPILVGLFTVALVLEPAMLLNNRARFGSAGVWRLFSPRPISPWIGGALRKKCLTP